jgi:sulfur carrier protein
MQIIVNGENKIITEMSLTRFLESINIDPRRVAVELNKEIIPKNTFESTILHEGDRIEIVHFVGGG